MEDRERKAFILSALTYTPISVLVAGLFFLATTLAGQYDPVARYGGTAWVFLLAMIITMPTITPLWKKAFKK